MNAQAQAYGRRQFLFAIALTVLAMLTVGLIHPAGAQMDRVSCGFFETQEDAQAALEVRPELAITLDSDGDGIACEELVTGGPVVVDPVSCGFFETREDAQAALDENPELAITLDSDGNGIACDDDQTGERTVVVCNEALGNLVEVSEEALEQDSLDFPFHRATEAEIAAGECATVIVCNTANGRLIEVSDTGAVLDGLDFPSRRATEAEIAAGTCAATPPVTPVTTPVAPGEEGDSGKVTSLPTTGTGTSAEQGPQVPLIAAPLVLTLAILLLRSRAWRSLI